MKKKDQINSLTLSEAIDVFKKSSIEKINFDTEDSYIKKKARKILRESGKTLKEYLNGKP